MYSCHEFHESYYPHTCLIIPEKDVLDTDIVGTGFVSRVERWWHDLFLLSYNSPRSRAFYTSYHAMRIDRYRHYRKYQKRIHPMSKFRNFWDWLILHVFIINKILFRYTSTFIFDALPTSLYRLGALFDVIIIADLYVNIKSGYIDVDIKHVVLDTKWSLINYCTKKMFLHLASAIPLHLIMLLRYGSNIDCGLCKTNQFTCALKILSIFSLYRVYETSAYWIQKRERIFFYKFLRILVLGLVTMDQFYDLSDVVCLLVFINNGYVVRNSSLGMLAGIRFSNLTKDRVFTYEYISSDISKVIKSLLLFGFSIRGKHFYLDKLTTLVAYLIANAFYAWSLLQCYDLVSRIIYPQAQFMKIRNCTYNLLSSRQLSDDLRAKIEMYFDFKHIRLKVTEKDNQLYRCLPKVLKDEARLSCYLMLIMRIPLFTDWPLSVLEQIVLMMRKEVFLNNDIVAEAWVQGYGLMIVENGVLAVYSQNYKELGHLIDGDYFGELSLITDKELYMSYVIAITPCTVLMLEKLEFRKFMRDYPKLFYHMKAEIKEKFSNAIDLETEAELNEEPPKSDDDPTPPSAPLGYQRHVQ